MLRDNDTGSDEMLKLAVLGAKRNGRHVGICGEAPANYPEIAHYLAQLGIDSISVNPSSVLRTMQVVGEAETASAAQHRGARYCAVIRAANDTSNAQTNSRSTSCRWAAC